MEAGLRGVLLAAGLMAAGGSALAAPPPHPPPSATAPAGLTSKEAVLWQGLRERLETIGRGLDGVYGLSVRDAKTGATIEVRPDEVFPLASTIKVASSS